MLGSILLGEQAAQFLEGSAVAFDGIEYRIGRGRNANAFSPRGRDDPGQNGGAAGDELPAPNARAARKD
ncbi:hypothetical protein [Bradyrhizobium sp. SZCCHNR3117]|uniref:hypothetical protein n=1 Tax=Bradyrhizobium sp. SZCCHNR3117 TaxID=3057467 RepID=UPI0028EB068C|nr:hypothetical protein [Bradyrhizobium sp. SZCCHNR3117]